MKIVIPDRHLSALCRDVVQSGAPYPCGQGLLMTAIMIAAERGGRNEA